MLDFLETIFIWSFYVGLPLILILYFFDVKKTFFWFGLIFTGFNLLPLPDDGSFPSSPNREPITIVVNSKEFLAQELCSEFRGGGQKDSLPFIRKIIGFFAPNSPNRCSV